MPLTKPLDVPATLASSAEVIANLDGCFAIGFGRLGNEQMDHVQALARICSRTPLQKPTAEAAAALARNEFVEKHFAAIAVARAALQGAQYDLLRKHLAAALGRPVPDETDGGPVQPTTAEGPLAVWQESTRHWLMELALAGFKNLEHQTLAPFIATLEQLQDEPRASRLAALLTGFLNELLEALPITDQSSVPLYRWVDLWTRAMIGALRAPTTLSGRKVSGQFSPLGVDLRHHGYFVSADVYGLLEEGDQSRVARVTLSSYKVDVLGGGELWKCFDASFAPLLQAVAERKRLKVTDMTLLPTLDLLWDGKASGGAAVQPLALAAERLAPGAADVPVQPGVAAADRHPLQIAELVYLDGYQSADGTELDLGAGGKLSVAVKRISKASELQPDAVKGSTGMLGLLRFDGGRWEVQPLAVARTGKGAGEVYTGSGILSASAGRRKGDTLEVLRERAGKLLRAKA
jgi:hypothetical protein